jgi:hypothetical protein
MGVWFRLLVYLPCCSAGESWGMCIGKGYATSVVEVEGSCFLGLLGNQTRKILTFV